MLRIQVGFSYSVNVGTSIGLRHVIALWNTVNCNVQPVYLVISNALA